jgi:hypothetical protein
MITIFQGDSSDIITISSRNLILDDEWTARLVVVVSEDDPFPLVCKPFSKDEGGTKFFTTLLPEETEILEPGIYCIGMEVENRSLNFRRELRAKLRVKRQIVLPPPPSGGPPPSGCCEEE